jgi:hypothetical protein
MGRLPMEEKWTLCIVSKRASIVYMICIDLHFRTPKLNPYRALQPPLPLTTKDSHKPRVYTQSWLSILELQ